MPLLNTIEQLNNQLDMGIVAGIVMLVALVYALFMYTKNFLNEIDEAANQCHQCGAINKHECEYYGCQNSTQNL